jgi:glutaconyl-CoA/methylmalonyl-CoA decarboxylase subunit gamma
MTKKLRITVEGKAYDVSVEILEGGVSASAPVAAPAPVAAAAVAAAPAPAAAPKPAAAPIAAGAGVVTSPLAGKIDSVDVKVGQAVTEGQNVVTLEAMKMKTSVTAHVSGTVTAIGVNPGDSVEEGKGLITIG